MSQAAFINVMSPLVFATHVLIPQGQSSADQIFHSKSRDREDELVAARKSQKSKNANASAKAMTAETCRRLTAVIFDVGDDFLGYSNALMQLARMLKAQGHFVHYFAEGNLRQRVQEIGVKFHTYNQSSSDSEWNHKEAAIQQCKKFECPSESLEKALPLSKMLLTSVSLLNDGLAERVQALKPDMVLCDAFFPVGSLISQIIEVPCVTSCSSHYFGRKERDQMMGFLRDLDFNQECCTLLDKKYGINYDAADTFCNYTDYTICWTVPEFDTSAETNSVRRPHIHFWGACWPEDVEAKQQAYNEVKSGFSLAALKQRKLEGDTILYCSMGSLLGSNPYAADTTPVFSNLIQLYGGKPKTTLVLSVGKNYDIRKLTKKLPCNVMLARSVPQKQLLELADVFVTHGGNNSVNEALFQGCAMVCVPAIGVQLRNAKQVQNLGCGLSISNPDASGFCKEGLDHVTTTELKSKIDAVFRSKGTAAACQHMQTKLKARHAFLHRQAMNELVSYITANDSDSNGRGSQEWKGI